LSKIYTKPKEILNNEEVLYAGNHYISLPEIDPTTAIVRSLNIGTISNKALLELKGKKGLFIPSFYIGGKKLAIKHASYSKEYFYNPLITFDLEGEVQVKVRIYTDLYEKGLIYDFQSNKPVDIQILCDISSMSFLRFNSHDFDFQKNYQVDTWLYNPIIELESPKSSLAIAFGGEESFKYKFNEEKETMELECKKRNALYIALNYDADGASTTLIHLKRKGYKVIYKQWEDWLQDKKLSYAQDFSLERIMNENLFFNYFFSIGKDWESDRYFALTSRSPRYYVSGAFWERDSFLWSFPAIKLVNPSLHQLLIREMILLHSKNPGDHAHYIDGTTLYPGFELDEAASYFILLRDLKQDKVDQSLIWALENVWDRIEQEYDRDTKLYKTFLLPSDDPALYPLVTIDNVILWRGLHYLRDLYEKLGLKEKSRIIIERIGGIKEGIYKYLVKEVNGKKMFVWSGDKNGNFRLYNDPPGNLGLLHFYDFVHEQDEIFQNTIEYYYSPQYNYFFQDVSIQELACDHHPNTPSGLGLCGSILNPLKRKMALGWLLQANMDFGLLAESFDPNTGEGKTGVGFATGAGYLASVLNHVLLGGDFHEDSSC